MALISIKQLDGPGGYLRWKESLVLRAHTLGVARVLTEARPAFDGDGAGAGDDAAAQAAAKKWARDDALCRGHILATLSDRLLPDYARFATAADLWRALARTYDVGTRRACRDEFDAFAFDHGTGGLLLEQLAHAEALGAAAGLPDDYVASKLTDKLPEQMCLGIISRSGREDEKKGMGLVWDVARRVVATGFTPEILWMTEETMMADEDPEGFYPDGLNPEQNTAYWNGGEAGHVVIRKCKRRA